MIGWAIKQLMKWSLIGTVGYFAVAHDGRLADFTTKFGSGTRSHATTNGNEATAVRSMTIRASWGGHFFVDGMVDGTTVHFLIDTGATDIVLSPEDAARIGFNLAPRDYTRAYQTANGVVRAAPVMLRELRIGQLSLRSLDATVNSADIGTSVLGMSFLRSIESFEVKGDRLVLNW